MEFGIVEAARLRTRSRIAPDRPAPDDALSLCGTGKEIQAMNRHERRKAKALSRLADKSHGPTVVAVHEAGHALAKVLSIGELGYSIDEAIKYIDMGTNGSLVRSADGKMMMHSQGVTFGNTFSKDIATASREFIQAYPSDELDRSALCKIVELSRAAGADVGKWFRARVFDAVTGSMVKSEDCWIFSLGPHPLRVGF